MILGIDASTAGSGGAKRHLVELIGHFRPGEHGFTEIRVVGVEKMLNQLPNKPAITRVTHPYLNKGFFHRMIWQLFYRDASFRNKVDVLFSPFGTYTGSVRPYVSMSRNMLVFDREECSRFGISWMRLKFLLLFYTQRKSFRKAQGIIFLSKYAQKTIEGSIDISHVRSAIINHGVSREFVRAPREQRDWQEYNMEKPFRLLYVSTVWVYKHPWNIVKAVAALRKKGFPISFEFVGNNEQSEAGEKMEEAMREHDPEGRFVTWRTHVGLNEVSSYYHNADAFIFASTCENMPNILIEAMSAGLPVICSSFGPMPEFLGDAGVYMDPTSVESIEEALQKVLPDKALRTGMAAMAYARAGEFSWTRCANETFDFLHNIAKYKNIKHVQG